jgi:hypothetical protein
VLAVPGVRARFRLAALGNRLLVPLFFVERPIRDPARLIILPDGPIPFSLALAGGVVRCVLLCHVATSGARGRKLRAAPGRAVAGSPDHRFPL